MKPAPFDYYSPRALPDALAIRDALGADAAPLAGGQTLVAALSRREIRPQALIDLNAIPDLTCCAFAGDVVTLGATVRQAAALDDKRFTGPWNAVHDAIACMGFPATRARGTIGGSMVTALATGQLTVIAYLFEADFHLQAAHSSRTVACSSFFVDRGRVALAPDELLTGVLLHAVGAASSAYCECRSYVGGPVLAAAAVALPADDQDPARVLIGTGDGMPRRLWRAEELLRDAGFPTDSALIADAVAADLSGTNGALSRVRVGQLRAVVTQAWRRAAERAWSSEDNGRVILTNHNGRHKETG